MQMTNEEIVRDYNAAKNKQKQVRILADLNQTSPSEILTVLAAILHRRIERLRKIRSCMTPRWGHCTITAGVEGVKKPEKIMPRKKPKAEARPPAAPAAPQSATVYDRIETILGAIPEDASKYMRNNAMNLVVSMFSEYVEQRLGKEARDDA